MENQWELPQGPQKIATLNDKNLQEMLSWIRPNSPRRLSNGYALGFLLFRVLRIFFLFG